MARQSFDANPQGALAFLVEQGAYLESEVYRIEYPQFKYLTRLPLDTSAPDWTKIVQFSAVDASGELKILGPNSTDIPTADIAMNQGWHEIKTAALGYTYSLEEINYAYLNNVYLDSERATAVRDITEQGLNQIYLLGDKNIGEGLYTSPNVGVTAAGGKLDELIEAGNAQGVLKLFGGLYNQVYVENTKTVHRPTTFLLPPSVMQVLRQTLINQQNGSNYTFLQFLRENFDDCEFDDDIYLETAGADNARRIICYKEDIRVVKGHDVMPLQFMQPATADNVNFRVAALTRTGGTEWRIPAAAQYMDGV
ncbi:hypothetical protein R84981_002889 [Carnimonas sp. R-84981]|uniref:major capsid family protein n=1 Tax=Carnimonas bestiolae TaxID=3402172 RepID=UPI003EDB9DE7